MISTPLLRDFGFSIPIVGAPMWPMAGGRLAAAISNAGGLGMIGVGGADKVDAIERESAQARELAPGRPFGIGLMVWVLGARPELFDAAIAQKPNVLSLSFGDPANYVSRAHAAGIRVVSQVQDRASALEAERAGVDAVVAQGTEAGGHTGGVGTLPLLQMVLESVRLPVLAAGGIASGRGLAAVLAAGAQAAWIGTPFLVAEEARNSAAARRKVIEARETETVHTRVFDVVQNIAWPTRFPGRALRNTFTERWHGREDELARDEAAHKQFQNARAAEDYSNAHLYAGQSVGMIDRVEPAAAIVERLANDAEACLRAARALTADDA